MSIIDILTILLVAGGTFFFFGATVGLLRFPDFYARMHATGKSDTLGAFSVVLGIALYNLEHGLALGSVLTSIKVIFIAVFIFLANPTATHAITKAGLDAGVVPWTKEKTK
jgi:multicomponent Na+:H+ antiporter subunit G